MKIHFEFEDLKKELPRKYISEWVKPLYPFSRYSVYGLVENDLEYCNNIQKADLCVLPMTWNYYFENGTINKAVGLVKKYKKEQKKIFSWIEGDYNIKVPNGDFTWFHHGGYMSNRKKNQYSYPVIIRDPLKYLGMDQIKILKKNEKPKIGFCGLASHNTVDSLIRSIRNSIFKIYNSKKRPYLDLSLSISGANLRRSVLKILYGSDMIETEFIIRSRSGGQAVSIEKHKNEFWGNMLSSPYILCARGRGNFSARFYEALSMGRIPVFINSDCILPFDNQINWKRHCVWIEENEIDKTIQKLNNFHNKLSNQDFRNLQIDNRKLWLDKLTYNGFFRTFSNSQLI